MVKYLTVNANGLVPFPPLHLCPTKDTLLPLYEQSEMRVECQAPGKSAFSIYP
jgi:hypothetical protein